MLPYLLAAALAAAPTPCPSDLLIANPRLKVVRAQNRTLDNYIVSVDVKNRGERAQKQETQQRLDLLIHGALSGSQAIPPLGPEEDYVAAFRVQLPHEKTRPPLTVTFRYAPDPKNAAAEDCTTANDRLTTTL